MGSETVTSQFHALPGGWQPNAGVFHVCFPSPSRDRAHLPQSGAEVEGQAGAERTQAWVKGDSYFLFRVFVSTLTKLVSKQMSMGRSGEGQAVREFLPCHR